MSTLRVDVRCKAFGDDVVLRDLEFSVQSGEFVAILGPSGCGKSTLLNLIAALDDDYRGRVAMDGKSVKQVRLGYVFQEARLLPWLSVRQNVELVLHEAAHARALAMLRSVGLESACDKFPVQLSGGMQRRVTLARACAVDPELLLLDEPFVSLDAPTASRLRGQLLRLWRELGCTVLYVTHDLDEALLLADRVLCFSDHPVSIVEDLRVAAARPRDVASAEISGLRAGLLRKHPSLLATDARLGMSPT